MKTNKTLLNAIIDLGKATILTMGGGTGGAETKNRPFGSGQCRNEKSKTNSHVAYEVELGKATIVTLGSALKEWEHSWRPRGQ